MSPPVPVPVPVPQVSRTELLADERKSDWMEYGRYCVGERESGRRGGEEVSDVCRNDSSGGDSLVIAATQNRQSQ